MSFRDTIQKSLASDRPGFTLFVKEVQCESVDTNVTKAAEVLFAEVRERPHVGRGII